MHSSSLWLGDMFLLRMAEFSAMLPLHRRLGIQGSLDEFLQQARGTITIRPFLERACALPFVHPWKAGLRYEATREQSGSMISYDAVYYRVKEDEVTIAMHDDDLYPRACRERSLLLSSMAEHALQAKHVVVDPINRDYFLRFRELP